MASADLSHIREHMTHPITVAICGFLTLVGTLSGPFGTIESMTVGERAVFWSVISFGSTALAFVMRRMALRLVPATRPVLFELVVTGLMVLAVTPLVVLLIYLMLPHACLSLPCIAQLAFDVALITGAVFIVRRIIPGFEDMLFFARDESGALKVLTPSPLAELPKSTSENPADRPRLYRRLPEDETGTILHLAANGHYTSVTLDTGRIDIRMRFSDAVNEMDEVDGHCTHRSHWVACAAVVGHGRVEGKPVLELVNGMSVPVSRTYRPDLEAAGLLPVAPVERA